MDNRNWVAELQAIVSTTDDKEILMQELVIFCSSYGRQCWQAGLHVGRKPATTKETANTNKD